MNSTNWPTWCLADRLTLINLATGSFVQEQEEGGSERTQCSGQGPHPPVVVGTCWLRRLTAVFGLVQLREEEGREESHTRMRKRNLVDLVKQKSTREQPTGKMGSYLVPSCHRIMTCKSVVKTSCAKSSWMHQPSRQSGLGDGQVKKD